MDSGMGTMRRRGRRRSCRLGGGSAMAVYIKGTRPEEADALGGK
jgi:hypothetical protein